MCHALDPEGPGLGAKHKVGREFRTQRRPLNVAFVLRRTVEQAILCLAPSPGPTCFKPQLRQRNTAEPAPTHARASAIEANKRIKRLRRNGTLVAHNDAAANVDTHKTVEKARSTRAAMLGGGHDHAHLLRRAVGAIALCGKHIARVTANVANAGVTEDIGNPRRAPVLTRRRRGVARVDDGL